MKNLLFLLALLVFAACTQTEPQTVAAGLPDKVEQCVYSFAAVERVPVVRTVKNPVFPPFQNQDFDLVTVPGRLHVKTGYGEPTMAEIRKAYRFTFHGATLDTIIGLAKVQSTCKLVERPSDKPETE